MAEGAVARGTDYWRTWEHIPDRFDVGIQQTGEAAQLLVDEAEVAQFGEDLARDRVIGEQVLAKDELRKGHLTQDHDELQLDGVKMSELREE